MSKFQSNTLHSVSNKRPEVTDLCIESEDGSLRHMQQASKKSIIGLELWKKYLLFGHSLYLT